MGRTLVIMPAALVVIVLAGCAPAAVAPSGSPSPSASVEASATPTPDAPPEPFAISECETMLPLILAQQVFSANTEFFGEFPVAEFGGRFAVPEIQAALSSAPQARLCRWGLPRSDGLFSLVVAELPAGEQGTVIGGLTAAGLRLRRVVPRRSSVSSARARFLSTPRPMC
ncbi:MAG: hypothetical protein LH471_11580 [Salinibacterium sp.]|nr:hypothetical protein [Salinibacterium sp.]